MIDPAPSAPPDGADDRSAQTRAALTHPLYARITALMVGHAAGIFVCAVAMVRVGGTWPSVFMAANLAVLAIRLGVLRLGRRPANRALPRALAWQRGYTAVGLAWSAVSGAMVFCCILAGGDEVTRLLAVALAYAITSGLAPRTVGAPRYAMLQFAIWLAPVILACALLGPVFWLVGLVTAAHLAVLCTNVRHQHRDVRPLIDAQHNSRRIQTALEDREADVQAIFANATAGLVEVENATRRVLRVNAEFCRMVGRSKEELLSGAVTITDLTYPEDRDRNYEHWNAATKDRPSQTYEKRYVRPDGAVVWARVSGWATQTGPDGRMIRGIAITQDCTEQKAVEAALRSNEEMLRLSLEIGRIATYRRDFKLRLLHCGRQARMLLGLPLDDEPIPFAVFTALVLPEDKVRFAGEIAAAHAARREWTEYSYRMMHPKNGIRHIESRSRTTYDEDGHVVESIGVVVDVTERRQADAHIAHLAHHDPLTALPNRTLFAIRLEEALARARRSENFALFCVDLDHFKDVNDTRGHPVGDALLCAVTERLNAAIRPTDTAARLGGDEFALIQTNLHREADAVALAERLVAALQEPFELLGHHIVIGASIGIVLAPDHGMDAETLLRNADLALYAAKADGRGRYRLFERHMDADLQARRTLELDLRQALQGDEFELFYQPIVSVARRTVCGFEALLRWRHPTRGLVPPDRFIPQAEAAGLLVPIGAWVLRHACMEAATWTNGARIAVNLSAVQIIGETLVDTVLAALRDSGLDPRRLELEITETAMLHDTEVTLATLHELKMLGITIAMDDFGTGYSSLSYLQRFPFDKVKIDRSFTMHLGTQRESAAIVSSVIDLCASLAMRTTAEGVENVAQFEALARIGCTEAQGYYFSRPRPAADIPEMIEHIEGAVSVES
jgi:diguanylate cyclase (GGDEF)-like protein/PAS domain S-box-containing protein